MDSTVPVFDLRQYEKRRAGSACYSIIQSILAGAEKPILLLILLIISCAALEAAFLASISSISETSIGSSSDSVSELLISLLAISAAIIACKSAKNILLNNNISEHIHVMARYRLISSILNIDIGEVSAIKPDDVAIKAMHISLAVRDLILIVSNVAFYLCLIVLSATWVFEGNEYLLLVPLVLWAFTYCYVIKRGSKNIFVRSIRKSSDRVDSMSLVNDVVRNLKLVKLCGAESHELDVVRGSLSKYLSSSVSCMRSITGTTNQVETINTITNVSIIALSFLLFVKGHSDIGSVVASIAFGFRITAISEGFMWQISRMSECLGTIKESAPTFIERHKLPERGSILYPKSSGAVEFQFLTFGYLPNRKLFDNFCAAINCGEFVGIKGLSGSGKTTLVELLTKIIPAPDGSIFIDGIDINNVSEEYVKKEISVFSQDASLLKRSILANVKYANPDAEDASVHHVCNLVFLHEYIVSLGGESGLDGYDSDLSSPCLRLSGGQKQRLCIARSLLKESKIYIFDEPTSSIDSETAIEMMKNIRDYLRGKLVIVISHDDKILSLLDRVIEI